MAGHIKSIVPQRGGVAPIDNNTTFFAPFSEHTNDILGGTKSLGNRYSTQFDTGRINCGNNSAFDMTSGITIESWVYFTESATKEMFVKDTSSYEFFQSGQSISFRTTGNTLVSTTELSLNKWTHIAASFNGATKCIYIDGVLDASVSHTTPILIVSSPFTIGAYPDGQYQYKGRFSDVRLWNTALSMDEVKQAMTKLPKRDGLMGWWKLDENDRTIAYDYSSRGNDGLVVGSNSVAEGPAVYSFSKGIKGQGISIEEGTTNLCKGKTGISVNNATVTKVSEYEYVVSTTTDDISGVNFLGIVANNGTAKTFSFYVKGVQGVKLIIQIHTSFKTIVLTEEEQYVEFTVTENTTNLSLALFTGYNDAPAIATTFELSKIQLEEKAFATSFIDGVRGLPHLAYPKEIINPAEGTMSFWMNPLEKNPNSYPSIMGVGGWSSPFNVDWLSVYWGSGWGSANSIAMGLANGTTSAGIQPTISSIAIAPSKWIFVVCRWDFDVQNKASFTVWDSNGIKQEANSTLSFAPPTFANQTAFYVGCSRDWNPTSAPNAVFDELRIDRVYKSDAEIQARYYQGRSGW